MKSLNTFILMLFSSLTMAATEIKTEIVIQASPAEVWATLTAYANYPEWNSFILSLTGDVEVGNKIEVSIDGMRFTPTILQKEMNRLLQWRGRMLMPGLFDGKHRFELIDNGDGTTTFVHSESFKGILVPFLKKKLMTETLAGFERMNGELKVAVELNRV